MFSKNNRLLVPSAISRFVSGASNGVIDEIRANPRRILLVKQAERLGNIVLLNSAISAIKKNFAETEIDLLLPAKFADIMRDDDRINTVIPVHKKDYISRPWKLLELLKKLRKNRYDIAVDCSDVNSRSSTGAAYALLSGARVTAGWKSGSFFDINIPRNKEAVHASKMYLRLISGVFARELEGDPFFRTNSKTVFPEKPVVGINCGGRDEKKWPLDNFIRLGEILSGKNINAEYILGPDEENQRKLLMEKLPPGCKLLPLIPVNDLKKTFQRYSVFVTSDSGPMHIAWSLNIPVIAIFLSSEMDKFKPLSEGSIAIDGSAGLAPEKVYDMASKALRSGRIPV